jgi:GNAT superfamily N-acetyltransferase
VSCSIAVAGAADVGPIGEIVDAAYLPYVERIGVRPGPLDTDYGEEQRRGRLHAMRVDGELVGLMVMGPAPADRPLDLDLDNVALHPTAQGRGLFDAMLRAADWLGHALGRERIQLCTHGRMTANIELYRSVGFTEVAPPEPDPFGRVFMERAIFSEAQRRLPRVVDGWRRAYGDVARSAEALLDALPASTGVVVEQSSIGIRARSAGVALHVMARPPELVGAWPEPPPSTSR